MAQQEKIAKIEGDNQKVKSWYPKVSWLQESILVGLQSSRYHMISFPSHSLFREFFLSKIVDASDQEIREHMLWLFSKLMEDVTDSS